MNIEQLLNRRYAVKKFDSSKKLTEGEVGSLKTILQDSPSSVNIQPWHFTIATTKEGKETIAKSTADFGFNTEKMLDASALVVFSVIDMTDEHFKNVTEKEDKDGRYAQAEFKLATDHGRRSAYEERKAANTADEWLRSQIYLNAGHFVFGVNEMRLDSVIMKGSVVIY